jgi:16S rRNA (uracil1498-N3)-methyltransferase
MRRFFTDPSNVGDKYIIIDDKEDIKHIVKVLRLGLGDVINISDGEIWEYEAKINGISDDEISFLIMDKQRFATEPSVEITLYQGVPKAGKMELIIQKSVELGITAVVPLMMDRTVVNDNGKFKKR